MIADDLERLAGRGPHREPGEVVDAALEAGAALRTRARRTRHAVIGVSTAVMLVGTVVLLAQRSPDDEPVVDGSTGTITTTTVPPPVETVLAAPIGMSGRCATVEYSWAPSSSDIAITSPSGRSFSYGEELIEVATSVFMERGKFDDQAPFVDSRSDEFIDVTVAGFDTQVLPSAIGSAGPHVSFVFPPDASPDDPCNVWQIYADRPMELEPFVDLVRALRMQRVDTGAFAWVPLTELELTDDVTLIVHENCVAIDSQLAKGSMCGTPLTAGMNIVGTVDHKWAFGLAPPGTTEVTTGDATETRLLDIGGYQAFAIRVDPAVTNVIARDRDGNSLRTFPVEIDNEAPASTVPAGASAVWSVPCVDQAGTASDVRSDPYVGRAFGPLAPDPGLTVRLPLQPSKPGWSDPVSSVARVPGGMFVSVVGASPGGPSERIVAIVNDDGSLRWRRCLTDVTGWQAVPDAERGVIDVEIVAVGGSGSEWWAFDLVTGNSQPETAQSGETLEAAAAAQYSAADVTFDFSVPVTESNLRRTDSTGTILWERNDLYDPGGEGFRSSSTQTKGADTVALVRACVGQPLGSGTDADPSICPHALLGVDTADGSTRWQLDGDFAVSLVADGYAIIADASSQPASYQLLDVFTGAIVPDGISAEPDAFLSECCGGYDYHRVEADGPIAWTIARDVLKVWYPADLPGTGNTVDL